GFRSDAFNALRRAPGKGLVGIAIKTGQAVIVEDFGNNPEYPPDEYAYHAAEGMVAAMVMPMSRGAKTLGGLTIGFRTDHRFTAQEADLLEALAAQAGIALENASLYAQEKRRVAELAAVLDRMSEGVVVTDSSGRIVRCNEAASQLLGDVSQGTDLTTSEWQHGMQILGADGQALPAEATLLFSAAKGEQFTGRQAVIRRGEGRPRHISVDGRPVFNAKGEMVLAVTVIHDVTAAREMDLLKDEFLALAAHELKTPLTSIKGYAQMLLSAKASVLGDSTRRALQVMDQQADRVNRMVEQFLLVEEIRSGRLALNLERIDLAEIVARSCGRLGSAASAHAVICRVADGTYVDADERSLGLVLSNLLENALKFSPTGSPVEVTLSVAGAEARLSVRDHGVGIPEEKQGHVFDRFYQVQPGTSKGVGLGLYISQELIASHGGRMWLESREGEGSCFFFALPLSEARLRAVHE
ncbi:MAG TPA: ATP-binding protein, partial [Chloroflexota bacterium]